MVKLTRHEIEVLEMVAGSRPWAEWGAWLSACLESLKGANLITSYIGAIPHLTEAGRAALPDGGRDDHH